MSSVIMNAAKWVHLTGHIHYPMYWSAGTHVVALAAGYLDPPPGELVLAQRKQVVVAVTSNWHVFCLDHNLRLLWQAYILV